MRTNGEKDPRPESTKVSEAEGEAFEGLDSVVATLSKSGGLHNIGDGLQDNRVAERLQECFRLEKLTEDIQSDPFAAPDAKVHFLIAKRYLHTGNT